VITLEVLHTEMESPVGMLHLFAHDTGLTALYMNIQRYEMPDGKQGSNPILEQVKQELAEYFDGSRREFTVPIDPQGTDFRKLVWKELMNIPFGKTISYGELAKRLGDPLLTRAVGTANGANPISVIIPCHRVIGSNGHLTGYGGGIERKRWLLDHEAEDQLF
jgi:methylated-DNA-[protein]-cysteine S-methyltransferase